MAVRRATEADVAALIPLKSALHALHVQQRPDFFAAMTREAIGEWLSARVAEEDCWVLVDEEAGRPRGYVVACERSRSPSSWGRERRWCEIDEIAVDPEHRRLGVARALAEAAQVEAAARGLERVELTAWAFNAAAQGTFEALGFAPMIGRYERLSSPKGEPSGQR